MIATVNKKFLLELEAEREKWPDVNYAPIIKNNAKQMKGCYTRYVNNYDAAEQHLIQLKSKDKEKHRYLEVCKTHPEANGLDVRSLLIQPVQRVPRYRMLLEELLSVTDEGHPDEEPLREALERVKDVAKHINEEKRSMEEEKKLKDLAERFAPGEVPDLVRFTRRFVREGDLIKARLQRRQRRRVFLFNDLLLYAVSGQKGYTIKGATGRASDMARAGGARPTHTSHPCCSLPRLQGASSSTSTRRSRASPTPRRCTTPSR